MSNNRSCVPLPATDNLYNISNLSKFKSVYFISWNDLCLFDDILVVDAGGCKRKYLWESQKTSPV